jgi:hypothetical protein
VVRRGSSVLMLRDLAPALRAKLTPRIFAN